MTEPKKVLLVDDDKRVRNLLGGKLKEENFNVLLAKTGKEALEIFFSEQPDIILLDIIMPGMHGIEVLKLIKKEEKGRKIPILILTNFPDYPELKRVGKVLGCELLPKEKYRIEEVVIKVKEELKLDKRGEKR